jgi:hypothetical protein
MDYMHQLKNAIDTIIFNQNQNLNKMIIKIHN